MKQTISALGQWLSTFPYENITKHQQGKPRTPELLKAQREELGAGGTCFSLVNLAVTKARNHYDLDARYYLGDRPGGENRHCVIGFPEQQVFLDPGYLYFGPLPLHPESIQRFARPQNILQIEPVENNRITVQTERKGQLTWRYTLTTQPVARIEFERAWKDSFTWETFNRSNVMTRQRDHDMLLYLNGRLESISREERSPIPSPKNTPDSVLLSELFGVKRDLIEHAELSIESTHS